MRAQLRKQKFFMTAEGGISLPRFLRLLTLLLAMTACLGVFAESGRVDRVLEGSSFTLRQQEEILKLFREAEESEIPVPLLLPRLEEGIVKGVPVERLVPALRKTVRVLTEARNILQRVPGGRALVADESAWLRTAHLLSAGIPREVVSSIAEYCRRRPEVYRDATLLYVSLHDWGIEPKDGLRLVEAVVESSLRGEDFAVVTELLGAGRRQRVSPERLVDRLVEELPRVHSVDELEDGVLYP